jgi:molecular chaperone DnaJ
LDAHKPQRGQDLRYTLRITPQDGRQGTEVRLQVPTSQWCPQCLGSCMTGGKPPLRCPQCQGTREIVRPGWLLPGVRVCHVCQGEGAIITDPCQHCAGCGVLRVERLLTIDIPAGVRDGARLRLRGEGQAGRWGGPAGDLFVDIRIQAQAERSPMTTS